MFRLSSPTNNSNRQNEKSNPEKKKTCITFKYHRVPWNAQNLFTASISFLASRKIARAGPSVVCSNHDTKFPNSRSRVSLWCLVAGLRQTYPRPPIQELRSSSKKLFRRAVSKNGGPAWKQNQQATTTGESEDTRTKLHLEQREQFFFWKDEGSRDFHCLQCRESQPVWASGACLPGSGESPAPAHRASRSPRPGWLSGPHALQYTRTGRHITHQHHPSSLLIKVSFPLWCSVLGGWFGSYCLLQFHARRPLSAVLNLSVHACFAL